MTNPKLSISTTEHIGRVYQKPTSNYPKLLDNKKELKQLILQGEVLPSITNIINFFGGSLVNYAVFMYTKKLKEGGSIYEASKEHETYRDFAANRGTAVHGLIEEYIARGFAKSPFLPNYHFLTDYQKLQAQYGVLEYLHGFIAFCKAYNPEFITQEATLYGSTTGSGLDYAGTTDFVARINGRLLIGDWKTSSKLHDTVRLQLAAAKKAQFVHNEETDELEPWTLGEQAEGVIAVRFDNKGQFFVEEYDIESGWEDFKACRKLWFNRAFDGDGLKTKW